MPIKLQVTLLLSGRSVILEAELDEDVEVFKQRAQNELSVGMGRYVFPREPKTPEARTIGEYGLRTDDVVHLYFQPVRILAITSREAAFAAILCDGSVVTWGNANGGDSSAVQDQLKDVQHIQASGGAFAAILGDGSVVTWGSADCGGDSRAVQHQLRKVQHIQASHPAFAAILADGSVVTWGHARQGGDCSAVQDRLKDVQGIQAQWGTFAAILADGSVVTWGGVDLVDGAVPLMTVPTAVLCNIS